MSLIRRRSIIGGEREIGRERERVCVCMIVGDRASSGGAAAGCAVVFARETCREWRGDVLQMFEIPTSFPAPIYIYKHTRRTRNNIIIYYACTTTMAAAAWYIIVSIECIYRYGFFARGYLYSRIHHYSPRAHETIILNAFYSRYIVLSWR